MLPTNLSRREHLKMLLAAAAFAKAPVAAAADKAAITSLPRHEERIQWWREAKYGMFIHWGLYSLLCRDAWAMGDEDIPLTEYVELAKQFQPRPNAAREWAKLARSSGVKYMVRTTKHHERFRLFISDLT